MQKYINIRDAITLLEDEVNSEQYVKYLTGIYNTQYRHIEIGNLASFINETELEEKNCAGYLLGYVIPQLTKDDKENRAKLFTEMNNNSLKLNIST